MKFGDEFLEYSSINTLAPRVHQYPWLPMVFCTSAQLSDPAAWVPEDIDTEKCIIDLSEYATEIEALVDRVIAGKKDLLSLDITNFHFGAELSRIFEQISSEIDAGRGFVLIRGLPTDQWGKEKSRYALWAIVRAKHFSFHSHSFEGLRSRIPRSTRC